MPRFLLVGLQPRSHCLEEERGTWKRGWFVCMVCIVHDVEVFL